jgi:hypothetical protein
MQDETRLTPSEREIEAALGGLRPARAPMNRDRVMFDAGRTSARRQNRIWQGVSGCLGIVLLVSVMNRPMTTAVETGTNTVASNVQESLPLSTASQRHDWSDHGRPDAVTDYVRMRRAVLEQGIEALPAPSPAPSFYDEPLMRERLKRIPSST